jgi:hypothetical protein
MARVVSATLACGIHGISPKLYQSNNLHPPIQGDTHLTETLPALLQRIACFTSNQQGTMLSGAEVSERCKPSGQRLRPPLRAGYTGPYRNFTGSSKSTVVVLSPGYSSCSAGDSDWRTGCRVCERCGRADIGWRTAEVVGRSMLRSRTVNERYTDHGPVRRPTLPELSGIFTCPAKFTSSQLEDLR